MSMFVFICIYAVNSNNWPCALVRVGKLIPDISALISPSFFISTLQVTLSFGYASVAFKLDIVAPFVANCGVPDIVASPFVVGLDKLVKYISHSAGSKHPLPLIF